LGSLISFSSMSNKKDEVIFGAKHAGVTWLQGHGGESEKAKNLSSAIDETLGTSRIDSSRTNGGRCPGAA
jgi:hypothetical protein